MESYTTDSGGVQEDIKRDHFQACIGKAIPPTLEAFKEDIMRDHFQACIGKADLDEEPTNLDPLKFRWVKEDFAKFPCSVPVPQDFPLVPAELLKTIQFMCSSELPCSSLRCGCITGQLPCSLFCKYGGSDSCCNQMTKNNMAGVLMMTSIVMMKMMEKRMISYTMSSNAYYLQLTF